MHDAKGRQLKEGDRVLIPAVVKRVHPTDDYCNVELETTLARKPDGKKDTVSALNTGTVLRANDGDDNANPFEAIG
jgi:hypothetical protein